MGFEKSKTIGWGGVPIFLILARLGTLTAAAQKLKMAPSSVARHIEHLEAELGTILFQRTPQGYTLTDAARMILQHAETAESAIDDFIRKSSGFSLNVAGSVRIALPENFATELVIKSLSPFQEKHPDLRIEIVTHVRMENLTRRDADMAIRLSRPSQGNFFMLRVGQMESRLYASQAYLAAHAEALADDGAGHLRIGWDDTLQDLPLAQWLEEVIPASKTCFTASSLRSQIEAAAAGIGIAALPSFLADGLVPVGQARLLQNIYLISHRDIRRVPRIHATIEFLRGVFSDAQQKLSGSVDLSD